MRDLSLICPKVKNHFLIIFYIHQRCIKIKHFWYHWFIILLSGKTHLVQSASLNGKSRRPFYWTCILNSPDILTIQVLYFFEIKLNSLRFAGWFKQLKMDIAERFTIIRNKIPAHIKIVAVSKTYAPEVITYLYQKTGHTIFGENKAQELSGKHAILPNELNWHFIGHLQTNKVKIIAPFVSLVQSVDSLSICFNNSLSMTVSLNIRFTSSVSKYVSYSSLVLKWTLCLSLSTSRT